MYQRTPGRVVVQWGPGPPPRDIAILLGVVFLTYTFQFFQATAWIRALLGLSPLVWRLGFVWQLVTNPIAGFGPASIFFLLELFMIWWFGTDVYRALGRKRFWSTVAIGTTAAAVAATVTHVVATFAGWRGESFLLIQGQQVLWLVLVAAYGTLRGNATIYLMLVLPIQARWFLWFEVIYAFIRFLDTKDLAGLVGVVVAVGGTNLLLRRGGPRATWREWRLRLEAWLLRQRMKRLRRSRGFETGEGGRVHKGPWVN